MGVGEITEILQILSKLDGSDLEGLFESEATILPSEERHVLLDLTRAMKAHEPQITYPHMLRLGICAKKLSVFIGTLPEESIQASLHDIGKLRVNPFHLTRNGDFSQQRDMPQIIPHPLHGYKILLEHRLHSAAGISLFHHFHQKTPYPSKESLPDLSNTYSTNELARIIYISQRVSVIDAIDAMKFRDNHYFDGPRKPIDTELAIARLEEIGSRIEYSDQNTQKD